MATDHRPMCLGTARRRTSARRRLWGVTLTALVVTTLPVGIAAVGAQSDFARVDGTTLASGEDHAIAAAIDPTGGHAYFGTFTFPGEVVKVDLDTLERVAAITFDDRPEAGVESAATEASLMDPAGDHAYFFTTFGASKGRVIKIDLSTFTRTANLDLDTGWVRAAVVDPSGRFAYLGRDVPGPDFIDKIDLQTFQHVDTISGLPDAILTPAAVMDPTGRYAVFAQEGEPSHLHRVDLDTFTIDASLTWTSGAPGQHPVSAVIDPDGRFAYFGTATYPGTVAKIDMATFTQVDVLELPVSDGALRTAVMAPDGGHAYFGETRTLSGELVRVDLATFQRAGSIHFAEGETDPVSSVIAPAGGHAWFGTNTEPARVVEVDLDVPEPSGTYRVAGGDRFETAAEIALERFDPGAVEVVYLATGADFPDALAGGPLAAVDGAPILLTSRDSLPADTREALATLGPDRVVALGGPAVVSDATLTAAGGAAGGATTGRLSGGDRFATAAAIADALPPSDVAYLATGTNFPDALSGGAATAGAPILLVTPTSLPEATRESLEDLRPGRVIALGGETVVSATVLGAAAQAAGGASTDRLSGGDRYATSVAIARTLPAPDTVYVATGANFPDGLAGGPAAVGEAAPIMLVTRDAIPDTTRSFLAGLPALRRVIVLGGTGVISDEVVAELQSIASD